MFAAESGEVENAKMLLDYGADRSMLSLVNSFLLTCTMLVTSHITYDVAFY